MPTPFDQPPDFTQTAMAPGAAPPPAAPAAPTAPPPSPLAPNFAQASAPPKMGWGQLATLLPALLGGIKDPIVAGGALAGFHRGQDAKRKQFETDQQTQERRANDQADFYSRALQEAQQFDDPVDFQHWKDAIAPMAKLHGVDVQAIPFDNRKAESKAQKDAAYTINRLREQHGDVVDDPAWQAQYSVDGQPVSAIYQVAKIPQALDASGKGAKIYKKPDLMAVPAGDPVIDKNNPTAPPVFTAPAKPEPPKSPGTIEEQMAVALKAGDTATYNTLKKAHEEFAAAGRKGDPSVTGPTVPGDLTKTGDAYLQTLPADMRPFIKDLADYKMDIAKVTSLRGDQREVVSRMVAQYDPTFDMTAYPARQRTRNDFTSGKSAQNIKGINTAVAHLATLDAAFKALNNGAYHAVNATENLFATHLPVTQGLKERAGAMTRVRLDFNATKNELAGVFKANGATDSEIKSWQDTVTDPVTASPIERKAFIDGAIELMGGRLGASRSQYEVGMGKPAAFHMLSPEARGILTKLGADLNQIDPGDGTTAPSAGGAGASTEYNWVNGKLVPVGK